MTLQSISTVFKLYQFARSYEQATEELAKAQKTFAFFENKFEEIGKSLVKAQEAYGDASSIWCGIGAASPASAASRCLRSSRPTARKRA